MAIKGDMSRPCVIYLATNKVNGKRYVGVTSQKYLTTRISQHFAAARRSANNGVFCRSLRKYGREMFDWIVLEKVSTLTEGLVREMEIIAALKPEYNSTLGGDGGRGVVMSASGRKKMSDFHKGRAWHVMPHSQATKDRLRELGRSPANAARLLTYAGKTTAIPVVCLDTGERFVSASEAARTFGVHNSMIVEVCNRGRATAAGGRVFRYEGDHYGGAAEGEAARNARKRTSEKRSVICLNDNMTFETKKVAAEFYGIGVNTVARSCVDDGKVMQSGFAFNFLDMWCPNPL